MAKATKKKVETDPVLRMAEQHIRIIGTSPMLLHALGAKADEHMITGKAKVDKSEMRLDPYGDFQDALEWHDTPNDNTVLGVNHDWLRLSLAHAGKMLNKGGHYAGTKLKARLQSPFGKAYLYGIPEMDIRHVRIGAQKTVALRVRPILRKWCLETELRVIHPLPMSVVAECLSYAGLMGGMGDFRPEKGAGTFGQFRAIDASQQDDEWDEIVKSCSANAQKAAIANPQPWNTFSREIMDKYHAALEDRKPTGVVLEAAE